MVRLMMRKNLALYLLFPLFLLPALAIWFYLGAERNYPFWDFAMYYGWARLMWEQPDFGATLNVFLDSLSQNYNLFFALPSQVSFSLFDASRPTFILTNYVVYGSAYFISASYLLRTIYGFSWNKALLLGFSLPLLLPFLWTPLLEGYPDLGAAALYLGAVGVSFSKNLNWKKMGLIGVLLGLSIVFRRHYAYAALALIFTLGLLSFFPFYKATLAQKRTLIIQYVALGLGLVGTVFLLEPFYVLSVIKTDFISLYKSYERPFSYFLHYIAAQTGLLLIFICVVGLWATKSVDSVIQKNVYKCGALLLTWVILWGVGPGQVGHHYTMAVLPIFFIVCLASFFYMPFKKELRSAFVGVLFIGLITNTLYSFWLAPSFVYPSDAPSMSLFSTPRIPWVRQDMAELAQLTNHLEETTTPLDKIVVVGSSFIINQNLVHIASSQKRANLPLNQRFLFAPETDSQPQGLTQAYVGGTVFLVASPTQYHLDPKAQKVVTRLASLFPPPKEVAPLFEKDPQTFSFDNGVTLGIWRRVKDWDKKSLSYILK